MRIFRKLWIAALLVALTISTLYGEAHCYEENDIDPDNCAYMQSSHAAHWSAYVPIAVLIAAGICWSTADKKHSCSGSHCNSNSQNGLGSLDYTSSYNCSSHISTSSFAH